MAISMPKQQDIRRLDRQGVSRSEIARRPDVDRATVAKYADIDDMAPKPHQSLTTGHRKRWKPYYTSQAAQAASL